uniref:NAD(P)H dehydrogenase, quinone 1 n=1 Tax=Sinocyclocheilus grahami TaxID=75366 RepID=A0A672KS45_SINGR
NVTACDVAIQALTKQASATAEDIIYGYGFNPEHFICNDEMTLQKNSTRWSRQILTQGFAFTLQKMYDDNGIFKDKKAILSFTNGGTESMFQPDGIHGDFNVALWPLQNGVLRFCGFQVLASRSSGVQHSPPDVRNAMLDAWQERLNSVFAEKPLSFAPTKHFDLTFQG